MLRRFFWLGVCALILGSQVGRAAMVYEGFETGGNSTDAAIGQRSREGSWSSAWVVSGQGQLLANVAGATVSGWVKVSEINQYGGSIAFVGKTLNSPFFNVRANLMVISDPNTQKSYLAASGRKVDGGSEAVMRYDLSNEYETRWHNQWRQVAASFDYAARRIVLYVDGQRVNATAKLDPGSEWPEIPSLTSSTPSQLISLGTGDFDGTYLTQALMGLLDDVMIQDRVLSDQQMRSLYELGSALDYDAATVMTLLSAHAAQTD